TVPGLTELGDRRLAALPPRSFQRDHAPAGGNQHTKRKHECYQHEEDRDNRADFPLRTDWIRALDLGGPSVGTLLIEGRCANDSSAPLLIDGRSQTEKSGFVDDPEPAISGCISIIGRRAASRSGHTPKRPPGFAQIPRRFPTSEVARGRHRRDQLS